PSGRAVARNESKPGGEIPAASKGLGIADGRHESRCIESADARNGRQAASRLILPCFGGKLGVECRNPIIKRLPARQHVLDQEADSRTELFARLQDRLGNPVPRFWLA